MDFNASLTPVSCPFLKKQKADLTFKNLIYEVKKIKWRKPFFETKEILHGVNGEIRSGELTAIMGPSGAGKSTLLNILAGYKMRGVKGSVYVNNQERSKTDLRSFKRISAYILQDDNLRDNLTVLEAMTMACELKLGRNVSTKQKQIQIRELLDMLGLNHCLQTPTGMLSGGQRKRLSIAFELITNPPILFLDEPTTGLDSSSCSQCISLLKMLAEQGRTIACTIHQPSALIFEMFAKVYALAKGCCIYDGPTKDLVPYMSERGLKCPVYHNPADFLLEVAVGEYGPVVEDLIIKSDDTEELPTDNRAVTSSKFHIKNFNVSDIKHCIKLQTKEENQCGQNKKKGFKSQISKIWPANFIYQFYCLYSTNIILFQKAYKYRITQFLAHFLSATLLGLVFINTGNDASMVRSNLTFIFGVLIFVMFTGKMTVTTAKIPVQMVNTVLGVTVLYYLSNQPFDVFRFTYFQIFCAATALVAQAIGFFLGAWAPIKVAIFMGPITAAACSAFGFTLKLEDRAIVIQFMSWLSYFRSSFYSIVTLLYGYDREALECPELYCHFRSPTKILDELGMKNINIYSNLIYMLGIMIVMHLLTFFVLYIKLNKR
ncbi:hypothetical protein RUM44_013582 [Polyplax serrata]|uniref:ABC transporter domain-containing protein n=1 Tax=Polyplax serrata TaxID=468196 RepID=A0ABR1BI68_POLSC